MAKREISEAEIEAHKEWVKTINTDWYWALKFHSKGHTKIQGPLGVHLERLNKMSEYDLFTLYYRYGLTTGLRAKRV